MTMRTGVVTQHLFDMIAKQVEDHRLVVWYDPDHSYLETAKELELPNATVVRYDGSFFQLRHDIDLLLNDEHPLGWLSMCQRIETIRIMPLLSWRPLALCFSQANNPRTATHG
jgi:hypothetical protein